MGKPVRPDLWQYNGPRPLRDLMEQCLSPNVALRPSLGRCVRDRGILRPVRWQCHPRLDACSVFAVVELCAASLAHSATRGLGSDGGGARKMVNNENQ